MARNRSAFHTPFETIDELRDQLRLVNQAIQSLEGLRRARATALAAQFRRKMFRVERLMASLNRPRFH